MDPLVTDESRGSAEALATASTAVRPSPSVSSLVHREVGAVPVTLAAYVALKRFLPGMDHLVADEVGTF